MGTLYQKLDIRTSELTNTRVEVAAWESPVLQAVHGENVMFISESVLDREAPEAADEFARLAERYKGETEESAPFVTMVYGQFGPGVAALQKAITAATQEVGAKGITSEVAAANNAAKALPLSIESEDESDVAALI